MAFASTAIAVRRNSRTGLGSLAPGLHSLSTKEAIVGGGMRRFARGQGRWIGVGSAGAQEVVQNCLDNLGFVGLSQTAVSLAAAYLTETVLRQATMPVLLSAEDRILCVSPNGEIFEPPDGVVAIGRKSEFAIGAATGLLLHTKLDADGIVRATLRLIAEADLPLAGKMEVEVL